MRCRKSMNERRCTGSRCSSKNWRRTGIETQGNNKHGLALEVLKKGPRKIELKQGRNARWTRETEETRRGSGPTYRGGKRRRSESSRND
jgi:hypothetical protein